MAETMRVVLDNFWSWLGTLLIVVAAADGLRGLFMGRRCGGCCHCVARQPARIGTDSEG